MYDVHNKKTHIFWFIISDPDCNYESLWVVYTEQQRTIVLELLGCYISRTDCRAITMVHNKRNLFLKFVYCERNSS